MPINEDKGVYFVDWGVTATIGGVPVPVIFDNEFLATLNVESSNPVALAKTSDMTGVADGTLVVIPEGDFNPAFNGKVIGVQPDGTGFHVLELRATP